jgi:GNAT superfamily N-acetyltransferase
MEDGITIRMGEMNDADIVAEANIAMAWETERKRLDPVVIGRGVRALLNNPQYGFYVIACDGQTIAGSLMVTSEWSDWRNALIWWIQSLYIQPAYRRHGVFRKLYDFVRTQASQRPDVCGIRLYVEQSNHIAKQAYGAVGMHETSYRIYEDLF